MDLNLGLRVTVRRTKHKEKEHAKQVLKTRFYFNYLVCLSGTDTQVSHKAAQTLNTIITIF